MSHALARLPADDSGIVLSGAGAADMALRLPVRPRRFTESKSRFHRAVVLRHRIGAFAYQSIFPVGRMPIGCGHLFFWIPVFAQQANRLERQGPEWSPGPVAAKIWRPAR